MTRGTRLAAVLLVVLGLVGSGSRAEAIAMAGQDGRPDGTSAPAGLPAGAGGADLERRTSEVASELRCPVCQGVSVEESPTELARQMRAVVRDQLAAGRSPEEVRAYFVGKYGEWVLLEPRASGFNLVVYILPWLALLAGAVVIVLAVRRWTRPLAEDMSEPTRPVGSTLEP